MGLAGGEAVLLAMKGAFNEALICTSGRVLIIKTGFMTGQLFGSKVFQLPYSAIASVEVKFTLLTGYLEVSAGGMQNTPKSYWATSGSQSATTAPNCVSIDRRDQAARFRMACAFILERVEKARNGTASVQPGTAQEIERLWALHQSGALTLSEYETAKARSLGT